MLLSYSALITVPVKLIALPPVYWPAPENWLKRICVVPTVIGLLVVHTHPVSASVAPSSTNVKAEAISAAWSKSVARVNT